MSGKGSRGWEVSAAAPTPATESGTPEQSEIESFITGTEQKITKHSFWLYFWFIMLFHGTILSPLKSFCKLFSIWRPQSFCEIVSPWRILAFFPVMHWVCSWDRLDSFPVMLFTASVAISYLFHDSMKGFSPIFHLSFYLYFFTSKVHADGTCHSGIFYTATPFKNKEFKIVVKASKRTVSHLFNLSIKCCNILTTFLSLWSITY